MLAAFRQGCQIVALRFIIFNFLVIFHFFSIFFSLLSITTPCAWGVYMSGAGADLYAGRVSAMFCSWILDQRSCMPLETNVRLL